jgi:L-ascorbate metabolism protein UlaG (beta-lactamase superfamily)
MQRRPAVIHGHRKSSCDLNDDRHGGFVFDGDNGSWWHSGASGHLDYQNNSPFINMEYSSGRIETRQERDDPYSTEFQ